MPSGFLFFKRFLRHPRNVGAIFESSPFLVGAIMRNVKVEDGDCVVELGGGTGVVTEKLIDVLPPNAHLLTFEMDPFMANHLLERFDHPQMTIIEDTAQSLPQYLEARGKTKADVIVSIVPLKHRQAEEILDTIQANLKEGGLYVQVSLVDKKMFTSRFLHKKQELILLNFPPEKVHVCENTPPQ